MPHCRQLVTALSTAGPASALGPAAPGRAGLCLTVREPLARWPGTCGVTCHPDCCAQPWALARSHKCRCMARAFLFPGLCLTGALHRAVSVHLKRAVREALRRRGTLHGPELCDQRGCLRVAPHVVLQQAALLSCLTCPLMAKTSLDDWQALVELCRLQCLVVLAALGTAACLHETVQLCLAGSALHGFHNALRNHRIPSKHPCQA